MGKKKKNKPRNNDLQNIALQHEPHIKTGSEHICSSRFRLQPVNLISNAIAMKKRNWNPLTNFTRYVIFFPSWTRNPIDLCLFRFYILEIEVCPEDVGPSVADGNHLYF